MEAVPFQFSVVVIPKPGGKEVRYDFLKDTFSDPVPDVVEHLRQAIGDKGSVVAWNMSFEKGCNEFMASRVPSHADFLRGVNARMYDLMMVFRNRFYVHPSFRGSASLKAVLPNLIPKLSYENLEIQEGGTASASWPILTDTGMVPAKRKKLRQDMIDYCHRDVIGMVKIMEKLSKLK